MEKVIIKNSNVILGNNNSQGNKTDTKEIEQQIKYLRNQVRKQDEVIKYLLKQTKLPNE